MEKSVFDFQDYKQYLQSLIGSQGEQGRGYRSRMAQVMNCQRGFVTKVLSASSSAHLSLEQAERLSGLLGHSSEEAHFFILLILYTRAGTPKLRQYFRGQMQEVLNRRLAVRKEMQSRSVLSPEDHIRYYSAWYYAAIRVAVTVPSLRTREALAGRLGLPVATISSALDFLVSRGILGKKGDSFFARDSQRIHLATDHPSVSRFHANWRIRALSALDCERPKDLHYSHVVPISEDDALRIRSFLVEMIKEFSKLAAPSPEQTLYSFCLDYFEL